MCNTCLYTLMYLRILLVFPVHANSHNVLIKYTANYMRCVGARACGHRNGTEGVRTSIEERMSSLKELCSGLPVQPLPPPQPRDPSVPHAPVRNISKLTVEERQVCMSYVVHALGAHVFRLDLNYARRP